MFSFLLTLSINFCILSLFYSILSARCVRSNSMSWPNTTAHREDPNANEVILLNNTSFFCHWWHSLGHCFNNCNDADSHVIENKIPANVKSEYRD